MSDEPDLTPKAISEIVPPDFKIEKSPAIEDAQQKAKKEKKVNKWTKYQTTDVNAPLLYSKGQIFGFSALFTPLAGSILLSNNLKGTEASNKRTEIILFGVFYFVALGILRSYLPIDFPYQPFIILNMLAGGFHTEYYWNKTIGKETKYRKRLVWKPLLIWLAISIIQGILLVNGILNP